MSGQKADYHQSYVGWDLATALDSQSKWDTTPRFFLPNSTSSPRVPCWQGRDGPRGAHSVLYRPGSRGAYPSTARRPHTRAPIVQEAQWLLYCHLLLDWMDQYVLSPRLSSTVNVLRLGRRLGCPVEPHWFTSDSGRTGPRATRPVAGMKVEGWTHLSLPLVGMYSASAVSQVNC